MIGLIQPGDDTQSHQFLMGRLVHESISSTAVFDIFRRALPNVTEMLSKLSPAIARLVTPESQIDLSSKEIGLTMQKVRRADFMSYGTILVTVPEGFDGKMVDYLKVLQEQGSVLLSSSDRFLRDYILELAAFLSDADVRLTQKTHTNLFRQIEKEREGHQKQLKAFFKPGNNKSRTMLNRIVSRMGDLDELFKQAEQLSRYQSNNNYKSVAAQIARASELLSLIRERVEKEDITNFSASAAKNIAEGAYQVGLFVEHLSVHGYAVETALASVDLLKKRLDEMM